MYIYIYIYICIYIDELMKYKLLVVLACPPPAKLTSFLHSLYIC